MGAASLTRKRTPSSTAIVSPAWLSGPGLQVHCDQFSRFELLYGMHSTGACCPAFGCVCGRCCRCAILADEKDAFPRGAYAPRSWSGMRALGELWVFQLQIRPEHRCARERAQHTCVFQLWIRSFTTGGLRPPLLLARCRFAGENGSRGAHRTSLQKATFAVHKRTFTRAAGVSPPWLSEPHLQVQCDEHRRLDLACGVHATGGLRPPLLVAPRLFGVKNDIRALQTHVHKSGGREPAVVRRTASASAMG